MATYKVPTVERHTDGTVKESAIFYSTDGKYKPEDVHEQCDYIEEHKPGVELCIALASKPERIK